MEIINDKKEPEQAQEEPKRKVTIDAKAKVIFKTGDQEEIVTPSRDVFSVMEAITARLSQTKSKEEMEAIRVSVHSVENPEKSDAIPDGGSRWEGPYLVGGMEVEDKPIPDALSELTKLVIPGDYCISSLEQIVSQLFLRSRMDGVVIVSTFDGKGAALPLVNTMKEIKKENIVSLYRALVKTADAFRKVAVDKFKEIGLVDADFDKEPEIHPDKDAEERAKKLVLPSGLPASMAEKGIVTPEEARKDQVKVVGLV